MALASGYAKRAMARARSPALSCSAMPAAVTPCCFQLPPIQPLWPTSRSASASPRDRCRLRASIREFSSSCMPLVRAITKWPLVSCSTTTPNLLPCAASKSPSIPCCGSSMTPTAPAPVPKPRRRRHQASASPPRWMPRTKPSRLAALAAIPNSGIMRVIPGCYMAQKVTLAVLS